ncbi:MAG: Fe-S cluster assembly protein SufD [Bacteroidales bacterium]|jgi:Fe-S cluster assembly protein SufD|nr:Fe-S cluster assembly protein SufD [Bacteroidales bacterium]
MDKERIANAKSLMDMSKLDDMAADFNCNIPNLHTIRIMQRNGVMIESNDDLLPQGCRILHRTVEGKQAFVITIPDNTEIKLPLQMMNLLSDGGKHNMNTTIEVGTGSKVRFIHCDDSFGETITDSANTIDVYLAAHSSFDYYKMENLNNNSSLKTDVNFHLSEDSHLTTYGFSLNGKHIANTINVNLNQPHAEARLNGLYLTDKQQEVETVVNIFHKAPMCASNQLFKGILDDAAQAKFLGHVYVGGGSHGTVAMQTNKNILLTDKAKINTRPFLEIYNDDVKCSHGATIGQLDDEAMFYMRSRGISMRVARMLLMFAFCSEVIANSDIEALKESIGDIIKMRLQGELTSCCNCAFQCAAANNIDGITKLK